MSSSSRENRRPNVIWIFGDQHRGQATGYAGDPNLCTPNLDRMAANGVSLPNAVAGFPLCCPFRGSLLTSRYPHHCVPGHEYQMPPEMPTVAHAFKAGGYHTSYFGKWHVDGFCERQGRAAMHIVPLERRGGFDYWCGYDNNNAQWDSWVHGGEGDDAFHYRLPGYETDCLTDLLIKQIEDRAENHAGEPFFAVLSVQPPHNPYVADEKWMARHTPGEIKLRPNVPPVAWVQDRARTGLAGYYAQIENLDWNVGRVLDLLERRNLAEDTYVIFFSDHGDIHGSHGQFLKTSPLEEALRIPFIVYCGRNIYDSIGGISPDVTINHVDIAPTSLGLAGLDVPGQMCGTDYSALFKRGQTIPQYPDSAYIQSVIPTGHSDSIDRPWRGVVTRDGWKYVCLPGQPFMMFNLNDDPYEMVNLAMNTAFKTHRQRLHERLSQWITDTEDEFEMPDI